VAEEWKRYRFDAADGAELATVRHVAHVPGACRIIEDRRIKAGLIYDESKLNKSRIGVTWVSANTWGPGSIYGTVEFNFAWADIVSGRKLYWVEAMETYQPPAYRFLLSKRTFETEPMKPYNPEKDDGPLQLRGGKYYWNDAYTSEFMIEDDLTLDRCTGIRFVMHHETYCSSLGSSCPDRIQQPSVHKTGGRILAFVIGHGIHDIDHLLKPAGGVQPFTELDTAFDGLSRALQHTVVFTGPIVTAEQCAQILRGSLALYGSGQVTQSRALLGLIGSKSGFEAALLASIRTHFNDPLWTPF
jgi:hypothetical protein